MRSSFPPFWAAPAIALTWVLGCGGDASDSSQASQSEERGLPAAYYDHQRESWEIRGAKEEAKRERLAAAKARKKDSAGPEAGTHSDKAARKAARKRAIENDFRERFGSDGARPDIDPNVDIDVEQGIDADAELLIGIWRADSFLGPRAMVISETEVQHMYAKGGQWRTKNTFPIVEVRAGSPLILNHGPREGAYYDHARSRDHKIWFHDEDHFSSAYSLYRRSRVWRRVPTLQPPP